MLRIALNGYGRIGRALLRALFERPEAWRTEDMTAPALGVAAGAATLQVAG